MTNNRRYLCEQKNSTQLNPLRKKWWQWTASTSLRSRRHTKITHRLLSNVILCDLRFFLVHRWFPLLFFSLLFLTLLTKERGTCLCVFVLCRHCDTRRVWLDHCCAIVIVTVCRYSKAIPSFFILTLLSSSAIQTHERASLFEKRATSRSPRVKIYVRVCVSMSVDNSYFSFAFMKRATEPYFSPPFMSNSNTLFPGWRS